MKTTIKAFIYLLCCFCLVAVTGCSKDNSIIDEPTPVQPENPGSNDDPTPEQPTSPDLATQLLGGWAQLEADHGSMTNVNSTSRMEFGASDSLSVNWFEAGKTDKPYTIAKGKYTINGDSLRLEWKSVTTDSIANAAFATFYLSGKCEVTDNTFDYNYSVYDTDGGKLSGPHTTKFSKQ